MEIGIEIRREVEEMWGSGSRERGDVWKWFVAAKRKRDGGVRVRETDREEETDGDRDGERETGRKRGRREEGCGSGSRL